MGWLLIFRGVVYVINVQLNHMNTQLHLQAPLLVLFLSGLLKERQFKGSLVHTAIGVEKFQLAGSQLGLVLIKSD